MTRLLLVDDEEELLWSVAHRLRKEAPSFTPVTANSGREALALLSDPAIDLLVADLRMPDMNGMDLVLAARAMRPSLPVVVMTAYPSSDLLESISQNGSIEFIEKPFDFPVFLDAIDRALARNSVGFSGAIRVQTLPDVIQLYALSSATGALRVRCGAREGVVWFERGGIPHAQVLGGDEGERAFYEILSWQGGTFSMHSGETAPRRTITVPWMELVMEACRRADEGSRGAADEVVHTGWTIAPPPNMSEEHDAPPETQTKEETGMADYKQSLAKLDSLDGFLGACLADAESGMVLATEGGGVINLEIAGASNAEVVRAKRKAAKNLNLKDDIEDILITLVKQYHLIRPLKSKPSVFFYLALDRQRANLGMARITLADVEKDLTL